MHLNFTLKLLLARDWSFSSIGTNSTEGVIGQLQQNLVDFSVTPLGFTTERLYSYQATGEILKGKFMTIFRHPNTRNQDGIFLKPFNRYLWFVIMLMLLLSLVLMRVTQSALIKVDSTSSCQLLLIIFGTLCMQSSSNTSTSNSSRITFFAVLVLSVIIYQFYSTFIIGYLLLPAPKTITTLEKLLDTDLKYSIEEMAYNRYFFEKQSNSNTIAQRAYREKVLPNEYSFVNVSVGAALVKSGHYAYQLDTSYGYNWLKDLLTDQEVCELQEVNLFPRRPLHMPLPRPSPLKELFRVSITRFLETGVAQFYRRKIQSDKPQCVVQNFSAVQVPLQVIVGVYWMLLMGAIASVVLLIVETVVFRTKQHFENERFRRTRFQA
ncbi:ionotropic receptor 75a-like [Uranotaenia lowii]|uniref:ionotropic receptor 75a-like n=1 Tax=Uranotaenia lowii TaxID=190385 RepID=UPI00247910CA|nr:ionotropic receptor 75a-like [Uranotaenia lowii]